MMENHPTKKEEEFMTMRFPTRVVITSQGIQTSQAVAKALNIQYENTKKTQVPCRGCLNRQQRPQSVPGLRM